MAQVLFYIKWHNYTMCPCCCHMFAVNALTFEDSAYYYTESRRLANNQRVQLSQAIEEPAFAELLLEGGDGDSAASGETTVHDVVVRIWYITSTGTLT